MCRKMCYCTHMRVTAASIYTTEHEGLDLCVVSIDDDVGLLRNMVSREEEAAVMWIKD